MNNPIELVIKGISLHGLQFGDPQGEPVLALHGWLDNAASFTHLAPLLHGYNVVAIDLPGHGLSDHWADFNHYHLWAAVEDIELILDELGWQTCHLLGHSMGAGMSVLYAGTFPKRLKSLTLIEAIGPMAGDYEGAPERLANAILTMKSHNKALKSQPSMDHFVKTRLAGPLKLSRESSELLMLRGVKTHENGFSWRNDKRLKYASMMRLPEPMILSFLQHIQAPVLGIFAHDGLFKPASIESRWQAITASKCIHWLDGGHHLHLDGDVPAIAAIVCGFLQEHPLS